MKKFSLLILLFSLLPVFADPTITINRTTLKQGEFFQAKARGFESKPAFWFNSRAFEAFELEGAQGKYFRALIPVENMTKPGTYSLLAKTHDAKFEQKYPIKVLDNGKGVQKIWLSKDKDNLEPTAKELNAIGGAFGARTKEKFWNSKFIYPCKSPKSSPFGVKRSYNGGPIESYHKGLDFAGGIGTPVYAPAAGKVLVAGYEKDGFVLHGNTIILDHGQGLTSIYMHLNKIDVKVGDSISQGTKIGEIGHTGISTGPHLHWGTYLYGTSVEPELFIRELY